MILVHVKSVSVTDMGFIVLLKNKDDKRLFPIFIGSLESRAISHILMEEQSKRPMTHDLIKKILNLFKVKVQMVLIDSMNENTLCAKIYLQNKNLIKKKMLSKGIEIDARPSDAIALALKYKAGIFIDDAVFEQCAVFIKNIGAANQNQKESSTMGAEDERELIGSLQENKDPISKLESANQQIETCKKKLKQAIQEERFEEAAEIRDQINLLIDHFNED